MKKFIALLWATLLCGSIQAGSITLYNYTKDSYDITLVPVQTSKPIRKKLTKRRGLLRAQKLTISYPGQKIEKLVLSTKDGWTKDMQRSWAPYARMLDNPEGFNITTSGIGRNKVRTIEPHLTIKGLGRGIKEGLDSLTERR